MAHINVSKRVNRETGSSSSVAETLCDIVCLGAAALILIDTGNSIRDTNRRIRETDRYIEETERQIAETDRYIDDLKKKRLQRELSRIPESEIIEADYRHV